jgi:hypothetical protein
MLLKQLDLPKTLIYYAGLFCFIGFWDLADRRQFGFV